MDWRWKLKTQGISYEVSSSLPYGCSSMVNFGINKMMNIFSRSAYCVPVLYCIPVFSLIQCLWVSNPVVLSSFGLETAIQPAWHQHWRFTLWLPNGLHFVMEVLDVKHRHFGNKEPEISRWQIWVTLHNRFGGDDVIFRLSKIIKGWE